MRLFLKRGGACLCLICLWQACVTQKADYGAALIPPDLPPAAPLIKEDHRLSVDEERVALTKAYMGIHNQKWVEPAGNGAAAIAFTPRILVVHYTSIPTLEEVVAYFEPPTIASDRGIVTQNGSLNVGIQFIVDRDGTIYGSYPETAIARHTIGLNHTAIGIENVGNADLGSVEDDQTRPLTEAQLEANILLTRYLVGKYPTIHFLIGHMEYQNLEDPDHPAHELFQEDLPAYRTDKVDPGPRFLKALRRGLQSSKSDP